MKAKLLVSLSLDNRLLRNLYILNDVALLPQMEVTLFLYPFKRELPDEKS